MCFSQNSWRPGPMSSPEAYNFRLPSQVPMQTDLLRKALAEENGKENGGNVVVFSDCIDRPLQIPVTAQTLAAMNPVDVIVCIYRLGYEKSHDAPKYQTLISGMQTVALRLNVPILSHNLDELSRTRPLEGRMRRVAERVIRMGRLSLGLAPSLLGEKVTIPGMAEAPAVGRSPKG